MVTRKPSLPDNQLQGFLYKGVLRGIYWLKGNPDLIEVAYNTDQV